ncbi:MAG: MBL fold metallo-hydrolase [Chloroflexia bacterium]
MHNSVSFRWLGVAGVELTANGRTLVVDPFFSRPPFKRFLFGRIWPNRKLVREKVAACDFLLVTHAHWDHIMDVPEVALHTGAFTFGSPNTCRLLTLLGVPEKQISLIRIGDKLTLGDFRVEVLPSDHRLIPFLPGPGPLASNLRPPLRLRDYRMDFCFSFLVEVEGYRFLLQPGKKVVRADFLFIVPTKQSPSHYSSLMHRVQPKVVIPIHWDNLFRPLSKPMREYTRPGGMGTSGLKQFVEEFAPGTRFLMPEAFRTYNLSELSET